MKTTSLAIALIATLAASSAVQAQSSSLSVGYAQADMQDFKDLKGVNFKYRYEWDPQLSVISSFTYMSADNDYTYSDIDEQEKGHDEVKYYSLSVGPAWRFNDYISVYGLIGLGYAKWDGYSAYNAYGLSGTVEGSDNSTSFMYGVGFQVNPVSNLVIDVGYEGTTLKLGDADYGLNGFNVGIGYRF